MGVLGDAIRLVLDTVKDFFDECGSNDVIDEFKDVFKALKGK